MKKLIIYNDGKEKGESFEADMRFGNPLSVIVDTGYGATEAEAIANFKINAIRLRNELQSAIDAIDSGNVVIDRPKSWVEKTEMLSCLHVEG